MMQSGRFNHSWSIFMRPETQLCCMTHLLDSETHKPPCEVHLFLGIGTSKTAKANRKEPVISAIQRTIQTLSCCFPEAGHIFFWMKSLLRFSSLQDSALPLPTPPGHYSQNKKSYRHHTPEALVLHPGCASESPGVLVKIIGSGSSPNPTVPKPF